MDAEHRWRATVATVASGKGGTGKTLTIRLTAGEASRRGLRTLLVDGDPEANLSSRCDIARHTTGLGNVLDDAGAGGDELDIEAGAKRLRDEVVPLPWDGVDIVPAGAKLQRISQVSIPELRLLRAIFEDSGLLDDYDVVLLDSGGRSGALVNLQLFAADVAFATITPTEDAVKKAVQARDKVSRMQPPPGRPQDGWPLRWAGVVLTGFDGRSGAYVDAVYAAAQRTFDGQVCADVPNRSVVNDAYGERRRISDFPGAAAANIARIYEGFLVRDLLGQPWPVSGILR